MSPEEATAVVVRALHGDRSALAGVIARRDPDDCLLVALAAVAVAGALAGQFPDRAEAIAFAAEIVDARVAGEVAA